MRYHFLRDATKITLTNLVHNMIRYKELVQSGLNQYL